MTMVQVQGLAGIAGWRPSGSLTALFSFTVTENKLAAAAGRLSVKDENRLSAYDYSSVELSINFGDLIDARWLLVATILSRLPIYCIEVLLYSREPIRGRHLLEKCCLVYEWKTT